MVKEEAVLRIIDIIKQSVMRVMQLNTRPMEIVATEENLMKKEIGGNAGRENKIRSNICIVGSTWLRRREGGEREREEKEGEERRKYETVAKFEGINR